MIIEVKFQVPNRITDSKTCPAMRSKTACHHLVHVRRR